MHHYGRFFMVCGPTGSGKTTMAKRISQLTRLTHIELDALHWLPNWQEKPLEQFRADLGKQLEAHPEGWVCDGNYHVVRDLILPRATTVVWLRPRYWTALRQLAQRTFARTRDKQLLWGTNRETLKTAIFSRDSIILYQLLTWRKYNRLGRNFAEYQHHAQIIQLKNQKDIEVFLGQLV
jgi:adenylate kinase family enzyme